MFTQFGKSTFSKSGYRSQCKQCEAEYRALHKDKMRLYREKNKVSLAEKQKQYKVANVNKLRESNAVYRDKTIERRLAYNAEWYERNKLYRKEYDKHYKQDNKGIINNINANRRAAVLNRTPAWLTDIDKKYIKALYVLAELQTKLTGKKWHVDHDIPLQGDLVSGLHVPKNMHVILAVDNMKKGNRYGNK